MRKQLPLLIAAVFGFLMLVRFFVPTRGMERLENVMVMYFRIIGGFAMILGIASLVRVNLVRIQRRQENWPYGLVTVCGFAVMFLVGTFGGLFLQKPVTLKLAAADGAKANCSMTDDRATVMLTRPSGKTALLRVGEPEGKGEAAYPGEWRFEPPKPEAGESAPAPAAEAPAAPPATLTIDASGAAVLREGEGAEASETRYTWTAEGGGQFFRAGINRERNKAFDWIYQWVLVPMDSTIFSLLAFYIASAAFRSMRARDITSALLLGAAVIVMLGRAPLTAYAWELMIKPLNEGVPFLSAHHIPTLGQVTEWLMSFPNTAAKRAVLFGAGLAALAQSLRILVGIERPYMAGTGD